MLFNDNNNVQVVVAITVSNAKTDLDLLREVIARRFGIVGSIYQRETVNVLTFSNKNAVRLLRRIVKYMHHPLRRLRAELILAYYDKINYEEFKRLYEQTKYEEGEPDIKRNHALEAIIRAVSQTHTHVG
jgi:hypothetical protein